MFVLVEHYVSDVQTFWSAVRHAIRALPGYLALHHCIPTRDGSHAVCVWEAESIRDVKSFIESYIGHASRNLYFPVENGAGVAVPTGVALPAEEDPAAT
jgi:hypothetical protein